MITTNLFMNAKFSSLCAETGNKIKKGDEIFYNRSTKKAYCKDSSAFKELKQFEQTAEIIQDPGEQYFDNFCQQNNI